MKVAKIVTVLGIAGSSLLLQSCGMNSMYSDRSSHWMSNYGYSYGYDYDTDYRYRPKRAIHEERGYHLSQGATPTSHKHRDREWIYQQNQQHYTIEVGSGDKASSVAKKIHKSPRTGGSAQFRHKRGNQTVYTGVVGSYKSREDAEKALNSLPEEVRGTAKVRNWGRVQSDAMNGHEAKKQYSRPNVND